MRILGIDPGSRLTGYGVVDWVRGAVRCVAHGTLKLARTSGRQETPLEDRLLSLHDGLAAVIREFKPQIISVEQVFFAKNAVSALKLGQARGAVILTAKLHGLMVVEYSPSEVKQALVGHGHADKDQVARMVGILTGVTEFATSDASDGLALAICHAHRLRLGEGVGATPRALPHAPGGRSQKRSGTRLADSLGLTPERLAQLALKSKS